MLKKLAKTTIAAAAVLTLGSTAAFAYNDGKAKLNDYVYNVKSVWATTLYVSSSDGAKWDTIEDGNLQFWARMEIDTKWPGNVESVAVVLGNCSGAPCKSFPLLWSDSGGDRDYINQHYFSVSTGLLQGTTAGLALKRQQIIETCNQHLAPDGATKRHEFQSSLTTTFVADTNKRELGKIIAEAQIGYGHPGEIDHAKSGDFTFNVVCKPYVPRTTVDDLQKQEGEFKTTGIDLFLTTYSGATTQPNPATTCKKGRILVRHKTSKAGPAKFKLWTNIDGNTSSKVIDAWSSHDGNGGFKAEHTEWVSVSKTTPIQAMAEDMVNSIGQTTQWKSLTLQCTGTGGNGKGGGGYTVDNDTGNPDNDPPQGQTLTGDFAFVDHGAPKCPRTAKALVTFKSPKPDNIHYSLDCKFSSKSGVLTPQPNPAGGYMAATLVSLDVTKTADESCTLRTVAPYNPKDHVTRDHQFVCATPSGHGATSDLTPENRDEPVLPGRVTPAGHAATGDFKPETRDDNAVNTDDADKRRIDALRIAKEKAEAERRRRAKIAAEQAAQRKRDAILKAQQLKLQQEKARAAAAVAAKARANAIRALTAKRNNKVKVAPKRRTTTAPLVNQRIMNFR